jgi:hypothetical protein
LAPDLTIDSAPAWTLVAALAAEPAAPALVLPPVAGPLLVVGPAWG